MVKRGDVFKCPYCGSIVVVLNPGQVPVCCGKPMLLQEPNTVDAAKEKHVPVAEKTANGILVKVGAVAHPMAEDHFIQWVEIDTGDRVGRHFFAPGDKPEFEFHAAYAKGVIVKAYCNKHGLWKTTI